MAIDLNLVKRSVKGSDLDAADHDANMDSIQSGVNTLDDNKAEQTDLLTPVPVGAVFTDTTYIVEDGGLSENNLTDERLAAFEESANTDDQTASEVPTNTANFDGVLSAADSTVQKALDTLDDAATNAGDMLSATYDPQAIAGDAFSVDNHTSGTSNKVFTAADKTKLDGMDTNAAANTVEIDSVNNFTAAQRGQLISVTPNDSVATINLTLSNRFKLDTISSNTTIANPSGIGNAQGGMIYIPQDSTGGRTIGWGTYWVFPASGSPGYRPNTVGVYVYEVYSSTKIVVSYLGEIKC